MRHRFAAVLAVAVASLTLAGGALAFDCIRVSSSLQGLQQSTRSGNWVAFDMTGGGVAQLLSFFEVSLLPDDLSCVQTAYLASGAPKYFALGIGVAGGRTGHGPGVLALNAPDGVLSNGTGIDHLDDTVIPALIGAFGACGLEVPEGGE
jgi:hypothetical protein